jgi:hypothetical protein
MKKQLTGEGGKGSSQRQTDKKKFNDNWDRIFGNKAKKEKPCQK